MRKGFFGMLYKVIYLSKKGLFVNLVSQKQLQKIKKRNFIVAKVKERLQLSRQVELFEFLSLYYTEGENVYSLLLKYQQFAEKKIKRVCKFILADLRRGKDFSLILQEYNLFSEEINSFFIISRITGWNKKTFQDIVNLLKAKQKKQKTVAKKALYPVLLLCAGISMIFFVSYSIIPNFMFFFQDSGNEIPLMLKLLSKEHLWKVALVGILIFLFLYLTYRTIPSRIKATIPFINYFFRAKFQQFFWQLCFISVDTGVPLEEILTDYLSRDKKGMTGYALSTILSRLQRGLSFDKAIEIPFIEKKQRVLTSLMIDSERKKLLFNNFIQEATEKTDEMQGVVASLVSGIAIFFIAMLIFVLGYVMLIPLSQISEII